MALNTDTLLNFGKVLFLGTAMTNAPKIVQGFLVGIMKKEHIGVKEASQWVNEDRSLWAVLSEEDKAKIKRLRPLLGKSDWLNSEWAIEGLSREMPGLASYFAGDDEARSWLEKQLEEIKKDILT